MKKSYSFHFYKCKGGFGKTYAGFYIPSYLLKIASDWFFTLIVIEDFDNANELITCCNGYNQGKPC